MGLAEPSTAAEFPPFPVPPVETSAVAAWVAGVDTDRGGLTTVTRFPAGGAVHEELPYRHVVARLEHATLTQVEGASVLGVDALPDEDLFRRWPRAVLIASAGDDGCRVWTRAGDEIRIRTDDPVIDRWALTSWAYRRLRRGEPLTGAARLRVGSRSVTVHASRVRQDG